MKIILLTLCSLVLSAPAFADTRDSEKDKTSMERGRAPAAAQKQQEESAEAHSPPDSPNAGGTTPRNTTKSKSKSKKKESSSAGSSAAPTLNEKEELAFKKHDLDG